MHPLNAPRQHGSSTSPFKGPEGKVAKKGTKLGPVIASLNLKGGVGKTTVSAHVFRVVWSKFGVPTLLIDFDPQFNLSQTLFSRNIYDKACKAERTIMTVMEPPPMQSLFKINTSNAPLPEPANVSIQLWKKARRKDIDLRILPGDFRLVKYSLMDDHKQLAVAEKRFLAFIKKCRQDGRITVIDCNPSSSFLTLCALKACTHLLVPVRPDRYSILGVELLDQFFEEVPTLEPKPKMILLNGVPRRGYDRSVEDDLRSHSRLGQETLVSRLHQSKKLEAKPSYTGFATDKPGPYINVLKREIDAIADEIGRKLGLAS